MNQVWTGLIFRSLVLSLDRIMQLVIIFLGFVGLSCGVCGLVSTGKFTSWTFSFGWLIQRFTYLALSFLILILISIFYTLKDLRPSFFRHAVVYLEKIMRLFAKLCWRTRHRILVHFPTETCSPAHNITVCNETFSSTPIMNIDIDWQKCQSSTFRLFQSCSSPYHPPKFHVLRKKTSFNVSAQKCAGYIYVLWLYEWTN